MFCKNCGNNIAEGKSFCTSCGAPVGQASTPAVASAPTVAAPPVSTPAVSTPAVSAPAASTAGQPLQGAPLKPRRTGLIVGLVVAAVVVLAAAGVGIWLVLRGDDGGTVASSATTILDGAATTLTMPGVSGNEGGSGTTLPLDPAVAALAEYRTAVDNLLQELDGDNSRIPELATTINGSLPDVPQVVYDELDDMLYRVQTVSDALGEITPPPDFKNANDYLVEAAKRMLRRIQATMDGIQAAWDSGSTSDALPFFSDGRHQRDACLAALERFHRIVPVGTLPGD
jgi:hypothetical protein